jgi:putative transcriptional regulator
VLPDGATRPLEDKTDWQRLREMTDDEVHAAALADPDAQPLTEERLARMRRVPRSKTLRRALGLTQEEFADRFQIPLGTLRDWEQGRAEPDRTAHAYLRAIAGDAAGVARALHTVRESCRTSAQGACGVEATTLERANDVLERAMDLDDSVVELHRYRSMLEDLRSRTPVKRLAQPHVDALTVIHVSILRSTIVLTVAILDPPNQRRRERASLGQLFALLKDRAVADLLSAPNARRRAHPNSQKLKEARAIYEQLHSGDTADKVRRLRHSIAHLTAQTAKSGLATVEYSDIFMIIDKIEECVTLLYLGFGITQPRFIELKDSAAKLAQLFCDTYLRGVSAA